MSKAVYAVHVSLVQTDFTHTALANQYTKCNPVAVLVLPVHFPCENACTLLMFCSCR